MKPVNYPNAILAPIFPENTPKNGFIFFAAIIAVLIFSLPADVPSFGFSAILYEFFKFIPEINIETKYSKFPFITAICYAITLISGLMLSLINCLSRINLTMMVNQTNSKTGFSRFIFVLAAGIFLIYPFLPIDSNATKYN